MVDPIQGSGQVNFPSTPNNSYENMLDATDKLKTQMQLYQEALTNYRGDPSDFKMPTNWFETTMENVDKFVQNYNKSTSLEKNGFKDCVTALESAGIIKQSSFQAQQNGLVPCWDEGGESIQMLFGQEAMSKRDPETGGLDPSDTLIELFGAFSMDPH